MQRTEVMLFHKTLLNILEHMIQKKANFISYMMIHSLMIHNSYIKLFFFLFEMHDES